MNIERLKEVVKNYEKNVDNQDMLYNYMESAEFLLDYQILLSLAQHYLELEEQGGMKKKNYLLEPK